MHNNMPWHLQNMEQVDHHRLTINHHHYQVRYKHKNCRIMKGLGRERKKQQPFLLTLHKANSLAQALRGNNNTKQPFCFPQAFYSRQRHIYTLYMHTYNRHNTKQIFLLTKYIQAFHTTLSTHSFTLFSFFYFFDVTAYQQQHIQKYKLNSFDGNKIKALFLSNLLQVTLQNNKNFFWLLLLSRHTSHCSLFWTSFLQVCFFFSRRIYDLYYECKICCFYFCVISSLFLLTCWISQRAGKMEILRF